jgi:GntR family transcriptional repressor for pyruvate dehydrogenase complex
MTSGESIGRSPRPRPRVAQLRVAETVAAELRRRILAEAADGDYRLPTQDHLMQEFGVSHPSIREAIRILETEGLVTVRRGKVGGAEVHLPDESSAAYHLGLALQAGRVPLADLAAAVRLLEPMCAASCARRDDRASEVVPPLRASIDRSLDVVDAGPDFTLAAREFHALVVGLSDNATMRVVVSSLVSLWSVQEQTWAEQMARRGEYPSHTDAREAVKSHERVLAAIEAGDAAKAERLARSHIEVTQELVRGPLGDGIVDATSAAVRRAFVSPPT